VYVGPVRPSPLTDTTVVFPSRKRDLHRSVLEIRADKDCSSSHMDVNEIRCRTNGLVGGVMPARPLPPWSAVKNRQPARKAGPRTIGKHGARGRIQRSASVAEVENAW